MQLFVAMVILMCLSGTGSLIYFALGDRSFAVEPDYYRKGLAWDDAARQRANNERLGWSVVVRTTAPGVLEVKLSDRAGAPVENAQVVCEAFANARASDRRELMFTALPEGRYISPLVADPPGSWRLRFEIHRGGDMFTCEFDHTFDPRVEGTTR